MSTTVKSYRYQLPKKAIKGDCPDCGPKHRKTLSRYMDTQTGEALPESYGRCDREANCGYHLSPYQKTSSGLSYADEMYQRQKPNNSFSHQPDPNWNCSAQTSAKPTQQTAKPAIYKLPNELFTPSVGHYERNQFAQLLTGKFGVNKANELLGQYQIGTSSHWPGATVFWLIDEQGRVRGGQIKLFASNWHTEKYVDREGHTRSKTSWVHYALKRRLEKDNKPLPEWLSSYNDEADKCPCLFGLPQLATAPADYPVAIVEAPKTAIICSVYLPNFVWLAVMGKSYLKPERLAAVRHRRIILYPDLNAYYDTINAKGHTVKGWLSISQELRDAGFTVEISSVLEESATSEQKQAGLDLADFLLDYEYAPSGRIEGTVNPNKAEEISPPEPVVFRLPWLIESYWQQFSRPPLWYNKIRAHKAVIRFLNSDELKEVVTSIEEQYNSPSSILKPAESQLERLEVAPCDTYPTEWDEPNKPDAAPQIKPLTFFEWQRIDPHFSKLGLASLQPETNDYESTTN